MSSSKNIERAIVRENKVTTQPYVVDEKIAVGRDKAEWDAGKRGKGHRDFILREANSKVLSGEMVPDVAGKAHGNPKGDPVYAWIHHGRWVASCLCEFGTGLRCRGLEVVDPDDPVFLCFACHNAFNDGFLRPVVFPDSPLKEDLEAVLLLRPLFATRNWLIGEGISTLVNENNEHGIAVPKHLKKLIGVEVAGRREK